MQFTNEELDLIRRGLLDILEQPTHPYHENVRGRAARLLEKINREGAQWQEPTAKKNS